MPWINPGFIYHFHVGQRIVIPGHGPGVVVEVLERVRDCDGQLRTAYRVWLDCGREWWAHPSRMFPATVTNGGQPAIAGRKAEESSHVSNSECSSRTR